MVKCYDKYPITRYYGGRSGSKFGVYIDGAAWMLKFPKSTRDRVRPDRSYTTSPLSEYLGSHIYENLGIPVHETALGICDDKVIVACKDFLDEGDKLIEFLEIKNAHGYEAGGHSTSGEGVDFNEVLDTIRVDQNLQSVAGISERFWDMFVVDAVIGNNDRNNGNWGLIKRYKGGIELAPVYDNGNAFFNKRGFDRMAARLCDDSQFNDDAFSLVSAYTYIDMKNSDKKIDHIKPFDYMASTDDPACIAALGRFVDRYNQKEIDKIIDVIPERSNGHVIMPTPVKVFYKKLLEIRSEHISVVFERHRTQAKRRLREPDVPVASLGAECKDARAAVQREGWSRKGAVER
jgi:hypothetical protein